MSGLNNHRQSSQMKRRPQNKLNCSGRLPSRADAHWFHSSVRLLPEARWPPRAHSGRLLSVTGLPARTEPPNAPSSGRFIRIHPMGARGLRPGSGRCSRGQCPCWHLPARLGWIARQAVRSPQSWPANCAGMDVPHHRLASCPGPCESDAGVHILRAITS